MSYHTHPTENAILKKIDNGLEIAVRDRNLSWSDEQDTKRQKYAYLALRAFTSEAEDPITYSWFKYGASLVAAPPAQDSLNRGYTLRTPDANETNLWTAEPIEFAHFFKNDLEHLLLDQYWEAHNLDFLEQFYEHYAPERYKELYLANIQLRRIFEATLKQMQETNPAGPISEYERIGRAISKMEIAMTGCEEFDPVRSPFEDFATVLEDAFMILQQEEAHELGSSELGLVTSLRSFYRNTVWKLISSIISNETAVGPNSEKIEDWWGEEEFEEALQEFDTEFEEVKRQMDRAGLDPEFLDYPTHNDEFSATADAVEEGLEALENDVAESEVESILEELSEES